MKLTTPFDVEEQANECLSLSRDELAVDVSSKGLVLSVPGALCAAGFDVVIPDRAQADGADGGGIRACAGLKRLHERAVATFVGLAAAGALIVPATLLLFDARTLKGGIAIGAVVAFIAAL